ncbi:NADH-quinone oxidoreductase subunit C [Streptomyces sp. NPDC006450]|uniref:NADH-quinone oxidoreductase subunit C n=1 Tax=Streptomyces sp. NPDC006450 TaxID=3155458 RepID=UPI0033B65724
MNLYDSLPDAAATVFGAEAVGSFSYSVLTVDVPTASWIPALEIARDKLGCTYFDWLSAVDEPGTGFRVCAHVVSLENHRVRRLLLRTTVPHSAPSLPSAVSIYAGAEWHERETWEMFGVVFTDHPNLVPLLLPENFEGHPLRKDFVLAARVAKAWPGAKEPGEAHDPDAPKRRQMLPPGVPDPNDWGPMKGQLPPAPTRPARTPRAAAGAAADRPARTPREATAPTSPEEAPARPVRRSRSVADGSASQAEAVAAAATPAPSETPAAGATPPPAQAEAAETSAEPTPAPARPVRRSRSVADGSASQTAAPAEAEGTPAAEPQAPARPVRGSTDAPWHNPKPAFDTPQAPPAAPPTQAEPATPADGTAGSAEPEPESESASKSAPKTDPVDPESDTDPTPHDPTGGAA